MSRKSKFPTLVRLTTTEAETISQMFRVFDTHLKGKIPNHLARNLLNGLGFDVPSVALPEYVTLKEILSYVDQIMPEPEPALVSSLSSFNGIVAERNNLEGTKTITPQDIVSFMESLGRPPANVSEASLLLNSMLDYDDCAEIPVLNVENFNKEVINFAKKSNALRDFR